ncbi:MAG TPA: right-handed parallel beta-helix repeat-containing protein [bacterium]|nr:right-handed parallel beta-helix repeat-containing protein [bacterium]
MGRRIFPQARTTALGAAVLLVALLPLIAAATPTITIDTDAETYVAGDTLEASLSAQNHEYGVNVDVYVGLILPDSSILVYGQRGWTDQFEPFIPNIYIPSPFDFGPMTILTLEVPDGILGDFRFAAGLTYASTSEFIGEISFAPFGIESTHPAPTAYIDAILPNPATQGEDVIEFTGHGLDMDGTIEGYEWSSDIDGVLSTDEDFSMSADDLSVGTHTISYEVQDNDGQWSEPDTGSLIVQQGGRHYFVDAIAGSNSDPGTEAAPFKTITHALALVVGSEARPAVIHVSAGRYASDSNGETFPLNTKSWVSLRGEDRETTVLDAAAAADHVIFCEGSNNLSIEGFTITGGHADGSTEDSDDCGGGILCLRSAPNIKGNVITGNWAGYDGGGIGCLEESSPTIEDNTISGNSALASGGGIICKRNSSPDISYNTIEDNHAEDAGGGIRCLTYSSPTISCNTILNNSADVWDGEGGGIACEDHCSPRISNNVIAGNEAYSGGGVFSLNRSSLTVSNNTVADNSGTYGGGIFCADSSPKITDCIFWGNGIDLWSCSASYSCIEDGDEGKGNISGNPQFVSGPHGDYYLSTKSPCINTGSRSAKDAGLSDRTTQTDGTPDSGTVDMGYHYRLP